MGRYFADVGQSRHDEARLGSRRLLKIAQCAAFLDEVDSRIAGHGKNCGHGGFAGALREFGGYSTENSVCTKTVYKYISAGLMETKTTGLPSKLKRKPSHKGLNKHKNKTKLGKSIEQRLQEAESREMSGLF
ncbi:MAG: hypothetical protein FWG10_13375 [Eubacteriaceae bacterium]|nr:hypothetical protein [Eubacteriaceae bacterium]